MTRQEWFKFNPINFPLLFVRFLNRRYVIYLKHCIPLIKINNAINMMQNGDLFFRFSTSIKNICCYLEIMMYMAAKCSTSLSMWWNMWVLFVNVLLMRSVWEAYIDTSDVMWLIGDLFQKCVQHCNKKSTTKHDNTHRLQSFIKNNFQCLFLFYGEAKSLGQLLNTAVYCKCFIIENRPTPA